MKYSIITTPEQDQLTDGLYILFGKRTGPEPEDIEPQMVIAEYDSSKKIWRTEWEKPEEHAYNDYLLYCTKRPVCENCGDYCEGMCSHYNVGKDAKESCFSWTPIVPRYVKRRTKSRAELAKFLDAINMPDFVIEIVLGGKERNQR